MKKVSSLRLCALLCAALFLVGCASSGGGGNVGNNPPIIPPDKPLLDLDDIFKDKAKAPPAGSAQDMAEVSPALEKIITLGINNLASGPINGFQRPHDKPYIIFDYEIPNPPLGGIDEIRISSDGTDVTVTKYWAGAPKPPEPIDTIPANEFTKFDNGIVGWTHLMRSGTNSSAGTFQEYETFMLGGNAVGLDYTDFGYWEHRIDASRQNEQASINTVLPFILVSDAAAERAPAVGAFTGQVLASAWGNDGGVTKPVYLVGEATLQVTAADAGNITFTFNNFYTLKADLAIGTSDGGIMQGSAFALSDASKNTTGIILSSSIPGGEKIGGHFYGGAGDPTATEAVGGFNYESATGGIAGAFGVKQ